MKTTANRAALVLFSALSFMIYIPANGQSGALAVQDSATLEQQLDYIHNKTRVYNDYRAIRDDVFLKMKRNVVDTMTATLLKVEKLNSALSERNFEIGKLNSDLKLANEERDEAIRNKDSMTVLGINMNKPVYNSVMWFIILGLATLAIILSVLFRNTHAQTSHVKTELNALHDEFEEYRKSSREKYEKLVVSHHNEIMKLKNS